MNARVLWTLCLGFVLATNAATTAAPVYELIHEFGSGENAPRNPAAALIPGTDGNFYGTSAKGGTEGNGTVFRMSPNGEITVLVNFTGLNGEAPGKMPAARLIRAQDGALYGTTMRGGASDYGTIFKVTEQGQFTNLFNFHRDIVGNSHGIGGYPAGHLMQASDGNFYGMTTIGAAVDDGAVFRFTPGKGLTNLYNFYSRSAEGGLVEGSDGALYGATALGGDANNGQLFKVTKAGQTTVLTNFMRPDIYELGYHPTGGVARGNDGKIYTTTYLSVSNSPGSLICITPGEPIKKVLDLSFSAGYGFRSELMQGADGNFYTLNILLAASPSQSTVVRANPVTRALTRIVTFSGTSGDAPGSGVSGANPNINEVLGRGGLVAVADGNIYGTLYGGGARDAGVAFRLFFGTKGTTSAASELTYSQATLNAQINQGLNSGAVFFEYGITPDLSGEDTRETSPEVIPGGDTSIPYSVSLNNLQRNTVYYYRVWTTSPQGNRSGNIRSFTTSAGMPTISDVEVKDLTLHSAAVNCMVNPLGLPTEVRVEWSTADGTPVSSPPQIVPAGENAVAIKFPISNLNRGVTYDFTVVAESTSGSSGVEGTFTTVRTHSPVALDDVVMIKHLKPIVIGVLENDSDIDNDELSITFNSHPQSGTVRIWGKALLYSPGPQFNGEDSFRYTVSDGFGGAATAEVVIRHKAVFKGLYSALAKSDDQINGYLQIALSAAGGFTGTITLDRERRTFSGVVNENGSTRVTLHRPGGRTWQIELVVSPSGELGVWEGTVSDGTRSITFRGNRAAAPNDSSNVPGQFNCFLSVGAGDTQATGWGILTVSKTRAARFSGRLPNGTPFSAAPTQIENDGTILVYALSSGNRRHKLVGQITRDEYDFVSVADGAKLNWIVPQTEDSVPAVFPLSCDGSRWTVVAPRELPLYFAKPAQLHFRAILTINLQFEANIPIRYLGGHMAGGNTDNAVFQANSRNGLFSGVFREPSTKRRVQFNGILRQDIQFGRGSWSFGPLTGPVQVIPVLPN